MVSLSWVYCLRDHWKVLKIMCQEYFNPKYQFDHPIYVWYWMKFRQSRKTCGNWDFIYCSFSWISSGDWVQNERHALLTRQLIAYVTPLSCPEHLSLMHLLPTAYCLSFHFKRSRNTVSSLATTITTKMLCPIEINNKQSKF